MSFKSRVGLICLRDSPLRLVFNLYLHTLKSSYTDIEFVVIEAQRWTKKKDLDRFAFRTENFFINHAPQNDIFVEYETVVVDTHNQPKDVELLRRCEIDLGINLGTHCIVPKAFLESFPLGVLNAHPGILPKYRGSCCVEWSLMNQDLTGCSLHFMDEKVDTGPILSEIVLKNQDALTYQEIRILTYWASIHIWCTYLKNNPLNTFKQGNQELKVQKDGCWWPPMPQRELDKVIEARVRRFGGQIDLISSIHESSWHEVFF